jgi:hypothetical protein
MGVRGVSVVDSTLVSGGEGWSLQCEEGTHPLEQTRLTSRVPATITPDDDLLWLGELLARC